MIKKAVIFLWGAAYMGSFWWWQASKASTMWKLVPYFFAILTSVYLLIAVSIFIEDHWNDE